MPSGGDIPVVTGSSALYGKYNVRVVLIDMQSGACKKLPLKQVKCFL